MTNKFFPVTNDSHFDGKLSRQQAETFVVLAENMNIPVSNDTAGRLSLLSEAPLSPPAGNIGSGVSVTVNPGILSAPATTFNLGDGTAVQGQDITAIAMLRQLLPQLIAFETMGIQPMKSASALAFACKWVNADGKAWFNPANPLTVTSATNSTYTNALEDQADAQAAYDAAVLGGNPTTIAAALATLNAAKVVTGNAGSVSVSTRSAELAERYEQQTVAARWYRLQAAARSRLYKTEITEEVVTDIQNATGFSIVKDVAKAMANVAAWNINREAIDLMKKAAIVISTEIALGEFTATEYHKFFYNLRQASEQIARETGGVMGNFAIVSPKVGSYIWSYVEGINKRVDHNTQPLEGCHAYLCTLADGMKIFVDHSATSDYALVGAKGRNEADAGIFFLPYQLSNRISIAPTADATNYMVAVPARYAFIQNPFATGLDNALSQDSLTNSQNRFYRIFTTITGLPSIAV